MNHKVRFYSEDETHLITLNGIIVPQAGETFHLMIKRDENWWKKNFPQVKENFKESWAKDKLPITKFEVVNVNRYIYVGETVTEDKLDGNVYHFPTNAVQDMFDVVVKKLD